MPELGPRQRDGKPVAKGAAGAALARAATRRRSWQQLLGIALAGYGAVGIVLFLVVAMVISRPLERAQQLSASFEVQRVAVIASLDQAHTTIIQMGAGVGRMDTSLVDAKAATDRSSALARGVALSMFGLRDAMSISLFGAQPLLSLASGFDQSGQQLDLLGQDLGTIGAALETNRTDVITTANDLAQLGASVGQLTTIMRDAPGLEISTATLDSVRLAIYGICGWLVMLATGCLVSGLYLVRIGRAPAVD